MPSNKDKPCLPQHMLLQLANAMAGRYGFRHIESRELAAMYSKTKVPLPIMLRNRGGTLWVDRYYVAIQHDDDDVRYVFLAEAHIHEEIYNYQVLKKCRENPPALPREIAEQFRYALRRMRAAKVPVFVSKEALELGIPWVETLYNKVFPNRSKSE